MLRLPVAGALAFALLIPSVAQAGTVTLENEVIVFKGTGDEKNSVRLEGIDHPDYGPMISIFDGDATITAVDLDYCLPVEEASTACLYGAEGIRLELGGGDDWARIDRAFESGGTTVAVPLTMLGGAGNDTLADENEVTVARRFEGGPGNDAIQAEDGTDVVLGADGNDVLDGGAGNDEVRGGAGDDTVRGDRYAEPGADIVDGGEGNDLGDEWSIPSSSSNPPVNITQDGLAGDGRPGENDNVTSIERFSSGMYGTLEGTPAADDIVTFGQDGGMVVRSLGGDDQIQTGSQKDDLDGGAGADTIAGGFGDDTITGGPGADVIVADGGTVYCGYYTCEVPFGNDRVLARDGEVDSVDCGVGQDSVEADVDDVVAANCETVSRPSGTTTTTNTTTTTTTTTGPDAGPAGGAPTLKLLKGLSFSVSCAGACKVTAQLRYKGKVVGTARRTGSGKATIRLSKAGKRRLRRVRRAKLTLKVVVGTTTLTRKVSYRR